MVARRAWAAACLLVAAATDECHAPATNKYTMDPPAATYPARPLRELTTPLTTVIRWLGNDEESVRRSINSAEPGISLIPAPGPTPDQVELAKYRNALTAAKRALTEIRETSDDASARAASGLAEISEELDGEQH